MTHSLFFEPFRTGKYTKSNCLKESIFVLQRLHKTHLSCEWSLKGGVAKAWGGGKRRGRGEGGKGEEGGWALSAGLLFPLNGNTTLV